jgi:hypothetical protein
MVHSHRDGVIDPEVVVDPTLPALELQDALQRFTTQFADQTPFLSPTLVQKRVQNLQGDV